MWAALAGAALLWVYWGTLASYVRDQHYQEHFLYLWVFLALALLRTVRGPFRSRCGDGGRRDAIGLALIGASWMVFAAFKLGGSNIAGRSALVAFLTGVAIVSLPTWNVRRCLMHGLLMQFCFGLPYSVYYPLTAKLQWGVAQFVALLPKLGLASYTVEGSVIVFPHYRLAITSDCSGVGQALTFLGIAALGVLSAARNRKRTVALIVAAVAFAWLSNVARVGFFVAMVAWGATWSIDDAEWHAILGFLVFLPFVTVFVGWILRTHRPWVAAPVAVVPVGRLRTAWLAAPFVVLHLWLGGDQSGFLAEPTYWAGVEAPPGYRVQMRGPTEESDRFAYDTPWLVNVRFQADASEAEFDLFHYATRSRSHLCVHYVGNCLGGPNVRVEYQDPVVVDGRTWWRIGLQRTDGGPDTHVYYAFEVGGERRDDSAATQFEVLWRRVMGGSWEVRLTRVQFPGPMPGRPTDQEAAVLAWLGRLTGAKDG